MAKSININDYQTSLGMLESVGFWNWKIDLRKVQL